MTMTVRLGEIQLGLCSYLALLMVDKKRLLPPFNVNITPGKKNSSNWLESHQFSDHVFETAPVDHSLKRD